MKSGKYVIDRKNKEIFIYNNEVYTYDKLFKLIKKLKYNVTEKDCNWIVFPIKELNFKDAICIAFQETESTTDVKYDFSFWSTSTKAYKGWEKRLRFHTGFFTEYQSARDEITKQVYELLLNGTKQIYIIGWSLGASIAPICCEDMYYKFKIKPIYIGFEGACPCSNKHTKKEVLSSMNLDESINFRNNTDIIPLVPPFPICWRLKELMYQLDYHNIKFPFKFIKTIVSTIKDTEFYHTHVDEAINDLMEKDYENIR